jgi:hypothetical protein
MARLTYQDLSRTQSKKPRGSSLHEVLKASTDILGGITDVAAR